MSTFLLKFFSLLNDWGLPNLCDSALTAGVKLDTSGVIEKLIESAEALIGKVVNVRTWVKNDYANAKIVKEFKNKKKAATADTGF